MIAGAPAGSRASRLLGGPGDSRRGAVTALVSTIVVFGLIAWAVTSAPQWPAVRDQFFRIDYFLRFLPDVLRGFVTNIQLFLTAEVLVLLLGLLVAIARSLPGPAMLPFRLLAIAYTDFFRAVPGIVIILGLGLGFPALGLPGIPREPFVWALVSLTLLYGAYVAEVYRAGIDSIHPSQEAAARSLGLSRLQALRYVIVPQAVRRVIPPLLNDFIGLQKDTALVSIIGTVEIFRVAQIRVAGTFNYTPYLATALVFVVVTVPMIRLVDVLIARERRRLLAGAQ